MGGTGGGVEIRLYRRGDEFMILLVDCAPDMAGRLVERIGTVEVSFQGAKIAVGCCAGWAGYRPGEPPERLLERADQALYETKRRGKGEPVAVPA